jgi:hypothetical protein
MRGPLGANELHKKSEMMPRFAAPLACMALLVAGCRQAVPDRPQESTGPASTLLQGMLDSLRKVKPHTRKIGLVSLLPGMNEGERAYLVLARLVGPGYGSAPTTKSEELFALFWVDSALSRPTRLLDTFPTARRDDWDVWLQRSWSGTIVICAEGATYADQPMRRVITLDSNAVGTVSIEATRERTPETWNENGGCSSTGPKGGD